MLETAQILIVLSQKAVSFKPRLVCHICGYTRARLYKSQLMIHMKVHAHENPYRCKFCHKRFKQQDVYHAHIKNMH